MTMREPKPVTIVAARLARAYSHLSAYSAAVLATELCAIERAQHRHTERCCSGADGGYVRRGADGRPEHDPDAENRAGLHVQRRAERWLARLSPPAGALPSWQWGYDPRGPVLSIRFPGESCEVAV